MKNGNHVWANYRGTYHTARNFSFNVDDHGCNDTYRPYDWMKYWGAYTT